MQKIQAFEAGDGTIFKSKEEAVAHDLMAIGQEITKEMAAFLIGEHERVSAVLAELAPQKRRRSRAKPKPDIIETTVAPPA